MAADRPGEASPEPESPEPGKLARFNTGVPHPARVYDAWLGGCFL